MINVCSREKCCGCGLCSNICPANAIKMVESEDTGHFVPKIDEKMCLDCGVCARKCPALAEKVINHDTIKTYASWIEDETVRKGCSSGGVATALYIQALKNGYSVVGTYMEAPTKASLMLTDSRTDIEKFKGSKYIQASAKSVYKECLSLLKKEKKVLFLGTPCQCAAMRSAVDGENSNLLLVELICHGTPSQYVFREYVKAFEQKKNKVVEQVSFRNSYGVSLGFFAKGKKLSERIMTEDEYLTAFQNGVLHNHSCYSCRYAQEKRSADLTIGDFWKIGTKIPFNRPNCKVSVIVVSTEKGERFIEQVEGLHLEERTYQEAKEGNPNLYRASHKDEKSTMFYEKLHSDGVNAAFFELYGRTLKKRYIKNRIKNSIKTIIKKFILRRNNA